MVQELFGVSSGLYNLFSMFVICFGFFFYVVEVIEYQQGMGECFCGNWCQFCVVQCIDQWMDIVIVLYGVQQFNGFFRGNQGGGCFVFGDCGKEFSFNIGGFVDVWWYMVNQQV